MTEMLQTVEHHLSQSVTPNYPVPKFLCPVVPRGLPGEDG